MSSRGSGAATQKVWDMYWSYKQLLPKRSHIESGDRLHICNRDVSSNAVTVHWGG